MDGTLTAASSESSARLLPRRCCAARSRGRCQLLVLADLGIGCGARRGPRALSRNQVTVTAVGSRCPSACRCCSCSALSGARSLSSACGTSVRQPRTRLRRLTTAALSQLCSRSGRHVLPRRRSPAPRLPELPSPRPSERGCTRAPRHAPPGGSTMNSSAASAARGVAAPPRAPRPDNKAAGFPLRQPRAEECCSETGFRSSRSVPALVAGKRARGPSPTVSRVRRLQLATMVTTLRSTGGDSLHSRKKPTVAGPFPLNGLARLFLSRRPTMRVMSRGVWGGEGGKCPRM